MLKKSPSNVSIRISETSVTHNLVDVHSYSVLDVPVLLVGGLVEKSDSLEVIFSLKELFSRDGTAVSYFTSSDLSLLFGMHSYNFIFNNDMLTENEKILMLNQIARDIIRSERSELLIVEAPDAVMKYSDINPNGFGIKTYMASLALNPQLFVCCIPYNLISQGFVEKISQDIEKKYGFAISAVNISNALADYLSIMQEESVGNVHTDPDYMHRFIEEHTLQSSVPLYNVVSDGAVKLYSHIWSLLKQERP